MKILKTYSTTSRFDSEPAYFFKIGERVNFGSFDECYIISIENEGYVYNIQTINYNKENFVRYELKNKTAKRIIEKIPWYEIKKYNDVQENLYIKDDYFFSFMQQDINSLLGYLYYGAAGVNMNPDYQRDFVWSNDKQERLIDSIFNNIDIGKFVFIKLPYKDGREFGYEILDGKQRLTTIKNFWEGRLKYKEKTINDISISDINYFENTSVSVAHSQPLSKEQKYRYFLKLNTGEPISQEHLEKVKNLWFKEIEK